MMRLMYTLCALVFAVVAMVRHVLGQEQAALFDVCFAILALVMAQDARLLELTQQLKDRLPLPWGPDDGPHAQPGA